MASKPAQMGMWQSGENVDPILRPDRPVGITVLTLIDGLAAGIIPALGTAISVMRGANDLEDPLSLLGLCLSIGLSTAVLAAAIGTYRGSDRSRLALLFLIIIHSSLQIFQVLSYSVAGLANTGSFGRSLGLFALIVLNTWYFLRPSTIAFYRRPVRMPG